ncbi:DUF4197 domain-containing protein [Pseudomarimonas arenosa]|uniref:DUF4197 domain-containing protein n=1 Tax=Pseudomarimonas arenosa TaxID=2774145 RepID=A0AAW3ZM06_9GAMM|nr:DUF4197 domain-containing protein [Pseudomarimonas arenosa]MBD8527086.1 DUF4197 domain-containing protein [Pseudomarimonas arenosa]
MTSTHSWLGRLSLCIALAFSFSQPTLASDSDVDKALKKLEKKLKGDKDKNKDKPKTEEGKVSDAATSASASATSISQSDAGKGIREALGKGVEKAISQLGQEDGFLTDQAVKILVPKKLRKLTDMAKSLGAGKYVDRFETSMNRAAEKAVPQAASILGDSIKNMSLEDAIGLVRGGETSATDYFRKTSSDKLREAFMPIVKQSTEASGVTKSYKRLIDKTGEMGGLLVSDDLDLDTYVTDKALEGLFFYIGEQEKAIRKDPVGQASDLLRRVFSR